jgi:hypothetical protein
MKVERPSEEFYAKIASIPPLAGPDVASKLLARRLRVRLLLTIVLAQVIALLWLLPQDPLIAGCIHRLMSRVPTQSPPPDYTAFLRNDPPIGFKLPTEGTGKILRQVVIPSRNGYLIVPVGDCAGCISVDLSAWQRKASHSGLSMVLLSSATKPIADRFRRDLRLSVPTVADPGNKIAKRLNSFWMARPYLFSSDWRLLWIPKAPQPRYDPFADQAFRAAYAGASQ